MELIEIGRKIKAKPVSVVFIEPQFNPKAAQVLAREYNLKVAVLDPLGAVSGTTNSAAHLLQVWSVMQQYFTR